MTMSRANVGGHVAHGMFLRRTSNHDNSPATAIAVVPTAHCTLSAPLSIILPQRGDEFRMWLLQQHLLHGSMHHGGS